MTEPPLHILDPTILQSLRDLEDASSTFTVADVIGLYLATTPPLLAALRQASDAGEHSAVRLHAHRLLGSSAAIGGQAFAARCSRLRVDFLSLSPRARAAHLATIEAAYADLARALQDAQTLRQQP